jgi:PKD repeat protein
MASDNTNPFLRAFRSTLVLIVVGLGIATEVRAQLIVNESVTPAQARALVEDLLVGSCVSVSNVAFTGFANGVNRGAVGSFSQGSSTNIGLDEGVLITTGTASFAIGPNSTPFRSFSNGAAGDPDLASIVGLATYDAAILEFDFVPLTDTLRFRYTFGSDEYSEYVNLGFNDVFGFFLSGPGYAGPFLNGAENIALIPNTSTYVAIDNVNNGNAGTGPGLGPCTNCAYYVENHGGTTIQYDGFTAVLTALAVVQPCQTYHMKFVIADAGDDAVDSGVFLGARSFSAGESVDVSVTANAALNEGCTSGLFTFTRLDPSTLAQDLVVQFTLSGTASSGVDFASIPNSFTIPAGQMSASLDITALLDYTAEGDESITITVTNTQCSCVPAAPVTATAFIQDKDTPLSVNSTGTITICEGQTATLSATPVGSLGPYQVEWDNGAGLGYSVDVTPATTTTYTVTVVDACGTQQVTSQETVTVVLANFDVNTAAQCLSGNLFNFTNLGGSGAGVSHHWDFGDENFSTDENPSHSFTSAGNYTVTHTVTWLASGCQAVFTTAVEVYSQPVATASTVQDVNCAQLGEVNVNVVGGESPYQYLWSTGETTASVTGLNANTYSVTVTDDNDCTGQSQTTVTNTTGPGPTAVCQNITVELNAGGSATIFASQIDNGSNDPCGIASMSVSPATFTCANVGANTVTLTVQNVLGATATCNATVTVQDNIAPTAICQNLTVQLNASGTASITAAQINNGSSDNCGIQSVTVSPNSFSCANIGTNTVTLTVTDVNGNVSTCNATVTVQDNIAPTAICQNITVQLNASGNASITAAQINNGSSDNCGIQSATVSPNSFSCANIGTNTVTLTVTDVNGNVSTCNATVTVQDNIAPTAICQNLTVQLNASGNASITAAQINNGSSDNCGIQSVTVSPNTFTCANIGTNTVTLTVTDVNGNVSTCNATVTLQDNIAPTAICQNITVQLNASGNASITAAQINNGSSDNCAIQSVTVSPNTFTCANIGANTVTLTVTDVNGNVSSCNATVTVQDNIAPTALCQNITVQLNASGNASITAAQINNGSSDNCAIQSVTVSPNTFTCANIGANTVTLTVTDVNGNTSTCNATATVQDNIAPTALCQNLTVQLDAAGNASITAAQINNGSSDNCGIQSVTVSQNTFTCANIGVNTVTLTVTDANGNVSTCNATVTVQDNIGPNALCQNINVQLDASGNASITAAQVDNGSTDNCGIQSITVSPNAFTCANIGANTVTLTVTDVNGNVSTCNATVTVQDNIAPTALCQNPTVQLDASGNASITAAQINNGSSDNCAVQSVSVSPNTFTCANIGANTVTMIVTDVNGNVSTCNATVTVQDNIGPNALCENINVQLDASGNASITAAQVDNGSTDNCGIQSITVSPNAFTCANIGANTVTLTVTDVNGNVSTCAATVTVQDNIAPTALCQNLTVQLDAVGSTSISVAQVNNGSSDNCGVQSVTVNPNTFTCANIGANTVTLTVTDVNGNTSTCNGLVTVQDNIAPTAICQSITVQLDGSGNASITAAQINNGSFDNCGIQSVTVSPSSFTCANIGPNTVTLTVTDVNGNVSTCNATVTVQGGNGLTALCQNVTVQLSASGNVSITAGDIDAGSSSDCGIQSITVSPNTFTCANIGANSVTLTVTDVNGNIATCNAIVTVQDNIAPTAVCQNITVQLNASGSVSITAAQINNGSLDNCGIQSVTVSPNTFTCANIGSNTVTLTVTDVNGNTSTCTATVTVQDNIAPTALCQNLTVQLDAAGNASITAAQINNGSSDNCGIQSVTVSQNTFTCANIGVNTVTLTVTDVNGNTSPCNATVTVQDNIAPTAVCQNITVQLDAIGNASITSAQINNGSSDNCGVQSVTVSPNTFTCANIGVNTVTLTVTDVNGNVSTCNATVTVQDNIAPTALCQNTTVQVGGAGGVIVAPLQIDNGSLDNCGITSMILTPNTFTCAQVGPNNVTLQVSDASGNTTSCNAIVTVETVSALVALCQNVSVQLDASGNASITPADIDNGSGADCGSVDIAINRTTFTCADLGPNNVTLTATDAFGNSETCNATVTVQDVIAPTALCQNIIIDLDATGNASITAAQVNNGSSDNCGIQSLTLSPNTFTCANIGANTVTLTVTDVAGNVSTCSATVTVRENIPPVAQCQNVTVQLNASGNASITAAQINNGSSDNCGIQSLAVNPSSFTCANIGANTVTLTVTDLSGNAAICNAIVTVQDVIPPVAICQDITVQVGGSGSISVNPAQVDNGSSDNCSNFTLSLSPNSLTCANAGPNQVTLTVTDASGNISSCDATVTVEVVADVIALCQNITVPLNASGSASITANDIDNGSGANCGTVNLFLDRSTFLCSDLGLNNVTLTASDGLGGTATCTSVVTVVDVIPPVSICQDITVLVDGAGSTSITAADINNGSFDNCAIASMSVSPNSFTCGDIGLNTVTLTVTDASGNSSFCNAIVMVNVTSGVSALCQNATVQLDASGNASITAATIDNGSGAECGAFDIAIDRNNFSCADLGANTVTLTISNASGNTETCQSTVTVLDNIPPTALCQNVSIQITGAGIVTVTPQEVDNGSADNCAITSMTLTPNTFSCDDLGENPVTLTVVDASGNQSSCTAIVSVEVISGLVATCQNVNVYLDGNGVASITANDVDNGSGAGCGDVSLTIDRSSFSCSDLGANTVTLTVTDEFGVAATCTSTITVLDTIAPVFTFCPADQILQVTDGVCTAVATWDEPVTADNCPVAISSSHNSGDIFPIGITTVTVTATDVSGNSATCTFEVEVVGGAPLSAEVVVIERACGHAISCHGLSDGQAEVLISGGCAPYSILWSTGVTTPQVGSLSADLYNVTVTDASGISVVVVFGLTQPEPLSLNAPDLSSYTGGLNISCKAASDGSITIGAQGGADCSAYTASWTGPNGFTSTDLSIDGLFSGTYNLNLEDVNGCAVNTSITLTEPDALGLVLSTVSNVSCAGASDGAASINAFGGTEPYILTFENGDPVVALIGLNANLYTITLTDVNGCVAVQTITITEPLPLSVNVDDVTDASCFGISDGEAELEILGGTFPFSVIWEGGQSGLQVSGLAVGQNTFTVTDANGCTLVDSVDIGSPLELVIDTIAVTGVSCLGGSDGSALASVSGGQAPYSYAWSPVGQFGNPSTNLPIGNLQLTVTDDNGCSVTRPFIVTQPPGLSISVSADTSICAGSPVVVSAVASGGAGGFIYSWNNGLGNGAQHLVSPSTPTSYSVTATDANGCSINGGVDISINPSPQAVFSASVVNPCVLPFQFTTTNSSVGATSYLWYQGTTIIEENSPVVSYDSPGLYTLALVAVSDNGCTDSITTVLQVQAPPVANFIISDREGCLPVGTVFTSTSTGGQTYIWNFGDGQTASGASAGHSYFVVGSYDVTLTVTSSQGCVSTFTVEDAVTVHPIPTADFSILDLGTGVGGNYQFVNSSTGGTSYAWQFGEGGFSDEVSPTYSYEANGGFDVTLTVINEFGCVDTARSSLSVELARGLFVPNAMVIGNTEGAGVFRPTGVGLMEYRALIFDNWGNQLWESTELVGGSPAGEWDGRYRGELVPQGAYIWHVEARFLDGTVWDGMEGSDGVFRPSGTITVLY